MGSSENTSVTVTRKRRNGLKLRTLQEQTRTGYRELSVAHYLDKLLMKAGVPELTDEQFKIEKDRHEQTLRSTQLEQRLHQEAA